VCICCWWKFALPIEIAYLFWFCGMNACPTPKIRPCDSNMTIRKYLLTWLIFVNVCQLSSICFLVYYMIMFCFFNVQQKDCSFFLKKIFWFYELFIISKKNLLILCVSVILYLTERSVVSVYSIYVAYFCVPKMVYWKR
jgi:hypothetical protein